MAQPADDHPHGSYLLLIAVYLGLLGSLSALVGRRPDRLKETPPPRELFLLSVATVRLSRLLTYDWVTSTFRLPFVEEGKGIRHIEGTQEAARGTGLQQAIGHLVNCSWCMSVWAALFNVSLFALFPRVGRFFLLILTVSGITSVLDPLIAIVNRLSGIVQKREQQLERSLAEPPPAPVAEPSARRFGGTSRQPPTPPPATGEPRPIRDTTTH